MTSWCYKHPRRFQWLLLILQSLDFLTHFLKAMAAVLRLPTEDFLSEKYMETFYKAHVVSKARGSLDEDIAAIEAEIRK